MITRIQKTVVLCCFAAFAILSITCCEKTTGNNSVQRTLHASFSGSSGYLTIDSKDYLYQYMWRREQDGTPIAGVFIFCDAVEFNKRKLSIAVNDGDISIIKNSTRTHIAKCSEGAILLYEPIGNTYKLGDKKWSVSESGGVFLLADGAPQNIDSHDRSAGIRDVIRSVKSSSDLLNKMKQP